MTAEEIKGAMGNTPYYNRYDKGKHWDYLGIIPGRAMQAAEFNELQNLIEDKIKSIGNSLYAEGTIIEGCDIVFNPVTKIVNANGGRVFLDGLVYEVEAATLEVPNDVNVQVGIWKRSRTVTEYEDNTLYDPAKGTPMYMAPGAYRLVTVAEWGLGEEGSEVPFFPIYGISGGDTVTQFHEKTSPEYQNSLARYDQHAHGHYVVEGLKVTALESEEEGKQVFSVSEGEAHIGGREASLPHSVRLVVDELPDLYEVRSEVHRFQPSAGSSSAVISMDNTPIEEITQIRATKERTVQLTHGGYTGCVDELPDTSVFEVTVVKQGALVFTEGTDFNLTSNRLNWSPSGQEPAPNSRYDITYRYRVNVAPDASTVTSVTLSDLVENSLVEIDYSYRMPRYDLIVMYQDCSIGIVRGISHRYAPVTPGTPPEAICLAEVHQTWGGLPEVTNAAIQVVTMGALNAMQSQIENLYKLQARNEMRVNASISAPSSVYGVFVDPLFDDDMRDAGEPQTAMIANETLQLPMETELKELTLNNELVLNYSVETIVTQSLHTKSMKVNPYQAFKPLPAHVTLNPAVDRWVEDISKTVTSTNSFRSRNRARSWTEYKGSSTTVTNASYMRQVSVRVTASGFGANEQVSVIFDGRQVACSSYRADANGNFSGTFTIPARTPTGTKLVRLQGPHTSGDAYFVGTHEVRTTVNYYVRYNDLDPLAQTFTLPESRHVAGVDFWLARNGSSQLRVEIRETSLGLPTSNVIASCRLSPSSMHAGTWNRAAFDTPVFLQGGTEYALTFLTDTADFELGITELGDYDQATGWVRSQAYQTGVLLSSSNANTWTPHQTADMAFRLLGARFNATQKTVTLGTMDLTGVTDVMPMAEVESTSANTDATFILKKGNTEVARMQAWQNVSFDTALDGTYTLSVTLFGDTKHSPVLGRDPQLLTGTMGTTGTYITRAFACGANKRVMVSTEEYAPNGSGVAVYVETAQGTWTLATGGDTEYLGDGWVRRVRTVPCGLGYTRLKIVLTGTPAARPLVQAISAVILNA